MARQKRRDKKFFTPAEANATLPLVRAIVQDIAELARDLRDRYERLAKALPKRGCVSEAHGEELEQIKGEFERRQEKMQEYLKELGSLGVELNDFMTGLIDFPSRMDGHEVCLCWRLGEPEVAHWHEIDAGFAGRHKLEVNVGG